MIEVLNLIIYGRVQGVGFRPSVCRLAQELHLTGSVRNLGNGVEILVRGEAENLQTFVDALEHLERPVFVERIDKLSFDENRIPHDFGNGFHVESSDVKIQGQTLVPADLAICPQCVAELQDIKNYRYHYPYISCANCGPRYSIIRKLPYDRETTTMDEFPMCEHCNGEYEDMSNRRGRAETISCNDCGPRLAGNVRGAKQIFKQDEALQRAKELLQEGKIIMAKAIGGFNLICRADLESGVTRLRQLKHRPTKPFAVMFANVAIAKKYLPLSEKECELLKNQIRPIVLVTKPKDDFGLAKNVAYGTASLGIFLPPFGLYQLLAEYPLVVTSANYSGAPIIFDDGEAEEFYQHNKDIAGFFTYSREILRPVDDSVVQVVAGTTAVLRRTRGYMPEPITVNLTSPEILATGAQMETSFCLTQDNKYYLAQVPAEAAEERTAKQWTALEQDWENLLNIQPKAVVTDLHPNYDSTNWGKKLAQQRGIPFLMVQHHFAHALSVIAEHHLQNEVLAVTFDGTGLGDDGTIWGGEFLLVQGAKFKRYAHLEAVPFLSDDSSMKQACKSEICYLYNAGVKPPVDDARAVLIEKLLDEKVNVIPNSSMGRLFDGVACALGLGEENTHQGCCAQRLERAATFALQKGIKPASLHFVHNADGSIWSSKNLWSAILNCDKNNSEQVAALALGFHSAVVEMIVQVSEQARSEKQIEQIVLTGGCFVNKILVGKTVQQLRDREFKVYINNQVPTGDGGLALGQAYYAGLARQEGVW